MEGQCKQYPPKTFLGRPIEILINNYPYMIIPTFDYAFPNIFGLGNG